MKKINQLCFVLITVGLLISCGSEGGTNSENSDSNDAETLESGLSVASTEVAGPLKDYIEVVEGKYPVEDYYSVADDKEDNKWKIKVKFKLLKKFNCDDFEEFGSNGIKLVFYDNEQVPYNGNSDAEFQFILFPSNSDDVCNLLEGEVGSVNWLSFSSSAWINKEDPLYMNFPKEITSFKVVSGKKN